MNNNIYMCGLSLHEKSKLINCFQLYDANNKKLYNGYTIIGSNSKNDYYFNPIHYNFYFEINKNLFEFFLNLNFEENIKNKTIEKIYNEYNLQEFFI